MYKRLMVCLLVLLITGFTVAEYKAWNGKGYCPKSDQVDDTNPDDKPGLDTVSWSSYLGFDLLWQNKWWTTANDTPGCLMDSGGTSGWLVINSKSVCSGQGSFQWEGCDQEPSGSAQVCIPTWRDGAVGGYSMTHDDIGAMDMSYLEQSWTISKEINDANRDYFGGFSPIRLSYGAQVNECIGDEWDVMCDLVVAGHEIMNHSWDHTSAAHQWLWYYQVDTTGAAMDEINSFTLSGGDTIPDIEDNTIPPWCKGAIVLNSEFDSKPGTVEDHFGYKMKVDGSNKYIQCNKMSWIDQCQVGACIINCAARDDGLASHYDGWDATEQDSNVVVSKQIIDEKIYTKLNLADMS